MFYSLLPLSALAVEPGLWQPMAVQSKLSTGKQSRQGHSYRVDTAKLRQRLASAVMEDQASPAESVIELPVNGRIQGFTLLESPIMEPGLAARYPDIKTYKVYGVDNPYASGRLSMTPKGLHGMITSPTGTYYIDPAGATQYLAYKRKPQDANQTFSCGVAGHNHASPVGRFAARTSLRVPGSLQLYRLAVAATAEYVQAVEPSVDEAQAEIVIAINRVNQIYERDLGIRLQLIFDNQRLSYTDPVTDPYTNSNINLMLQENQSNIDSVIGSSRYDVGHVFSSSGGGVAWVGAACITGLKAWGVTGLSNSSGDTFYIDYVAHEIGHQLGADHSFNGTTNACAEPNRWAPTAFEPGSGSTIMSYAGICGGENIQSDADPLFHAGSIAQIDQYTSIGEGANCADVRTISNNPSLPTADAGDDYVIPIETPFVLNGSGSDADGDVLSYTWDQVDAGTATDLFTLGDDLGDNALMRSRLPQARAERHFPQLDTQLIGDQDRGEVLPTTQRELNFRFSVRDGKSGIAHDEVRITTDNTAGPFRVLSHDSVATLLSNSAQTVTWSVAGTDNPPINCGLVDIDLLMFDSGSGSYCIADPPLAEAVPNNGSSSVTLPNLNIANARFRVKCSDNIFYSVSDADLEITGGILDADTSCQPVVPELQEHGLEEIRLRSGGGGGGGLLDAYALAALLLLGFTRKLSRRQS